MKTISVNNHPNADALKMYEFEAPGQLNKLIVANLENVYEVDDLVYIALEGSVLKDGTKIKPRKVRGVPSYGMALGKCEKPNAKPGDDFTSEFCEPDVDTSGFSLIKWPDIESLHSIRRELKKAGMMPTIKYRAKVKLDGTNAGVQIKIKSDGRIAAQSRSNLITPEKDNLGFATFVHSNYDYFSKLAQKENITIFGEWAGSGIQKRTAISKIDRKIFAIFAVQIGDLDAMFEIDPDKISEIVAEHPDIFVLPFYGPVFVLDFSNPITLQKAADEINVMVQEIEKIDPWVKDTFGIEGLGEGLVMYPLPENGTQISRQIYSDFVFKAKGEKHKVVNTKKPVQLDPEFVKTIDEFVKLFVTEARLEQGVTVACNGEYDMKRIGDFLKWFAGDVKKESKAELEAAGLEFRQVSKQISKVAREWYIGKVNSL